MIKEKLKNGDIPIKRSTYKKIWQQNRDMRRTIIYFKLLAKELWDKIKRYPLPKELENLEKDGK